MIWVNYKSWNTNFFITPCYDDVRQRSNEDSYFTNISLENWQYSLQIMSQVKLFSNAMSYRFMAWEITFIFATKYTCGKSWHQGQVQQNGVILHCVPFTTHNVWIRIWQWIWHKLWNPPSFLLNGLCEPLSFRAKQLNMMLTINFNQTPRLESLEVYLIYLYYFITWCLDTGTLHSSLS